MEECRGELVCNEGRCTLPCNSTDDCGHDFFCSSGLCVPSECGNGRREGGEECDAGQLNADSNGCTAECKLNVCGDENVYVGVEECDDGTRNSDTFADTCRTTCKLPSCGDGVKDSGEECDDGYTDDCGSCAADCSGAGSGAVCGDGIRCPEYEACDDGNEDPCDGCLTDCSRHENACGDGYRCNTEACDDAGDSAACDGDCTPAECGDGHTNAAANEDCDDGNAFSLDGCGACVGDAIPSGTLFLGFQSTVTHVANAAPDGIVEGDAVVFELRIRVAESESTEPLHGSDCDPHVVDCHTGAWTFPVSQYALTYSSGYAQTGSCDRVEIVDGGYVEYPAGEPHPESDSIVFYDGTNDVFEARAFDGGWANGPLGIDLDQITGDIDQAGFFDLTFYWGDWGDWGTYHYDYTTAQDVTLVMRAP